MKKDGNAQPGRTLCDFCGQKATEIVGTLLLCKKHAAANSEWKQASAEPSLKAAALTMVDKHR